ncbi:MAG: YceI family protein [Bizionia sp.]|nr:YceI family protein [Bizionia sp.]
MIYTKKTYLKTFSFFIFFMLIAQIAVSQNLNLVNAESSLTISGTSSLHDWTIDAKKQSGVLIFKNLEKGEIEKCTLNITVEGLESGKRSMDKNTHKALNSDDYKSITYQLVEINETLVQSATTYLIKTKGDLTISGVKKRIALNFTLTNNGDGVVLEGSKKLKMTDFNIDPPKALLGTITTGDDINIAFKTTFK